MLLAFNRLTMGTALRRRLLMAMSIVWLLSVSFAQAQSGDPPTEEPEDPLVIGDGTGEMSWDTGTTDSTGTTYILATAIFNGGTVTDGKIIANTFTAYSGQVGSVLEGSGALTKTTAGTLTLSAAATHTGGTIVSAGTLQIEGSGALSGNVVNHATIVFNRGDDYAFSGVISGAGNLVQSGNTFRFANAQTYTGATIISSGYLVLPGDVDQGLSALTKVDIALGAYFDLSNRSQTIAGLTGAGTVYSFGGSAGHLTVVTSDGQSQVFTGVLGGGQAGFGLTKSGSGVLTLTGDNTYTGETTISGGTLVVDGSLGTTAVSVSADATLSGSGTFNGEVTLSSGARLAPGTISFADGLTLATGSILDFELGTESDLIFITGGILTGTEETGGITLNLSNSGGFKADTYTLFDFSLGDLSTSDFDVSDFVLGNTIAGYTYSIDLVGDTLQLTATAIPEPGTCVALVALLGVVCLRYRHRIGS